MRQVWLFDRNLLSEHSSLSYIIRRFDFQTNIFKEIHNNHNEVQEYNMLLSVSTAADGNRIAIFIFLLSNTRYQFPVVPQNIYECNVEFDNRCYFKHLNLYGHGFFRTVSGSLFRVTSIPGSENRKSYEFFFFIFSISIKLFLWF